MKIIKKDFSFDYDMIHCPTTNEYIFAPGWESFDFKAKAFIAHWLDDEIEEPIFNNTDFQTAWEKVYHKWKEEESKKPKIHEVLEKFLAEYENPDWIFYELTVSGASCGPCSNTAYFVVRHDTLVETDPDYDEEYVEDDEDDEDTENQIKVIETDYPINCPFCDELIRGDDEEGECFDIGGTCEHLLFDASDYGFEYMSEKFMANMGLTDEEREDLDGMTFRGDHIDGFTSKVTIPGSIKYAVYEGLGGSLGAYFGFAP